MPDRTRAALEAALREDPDDLAGWHAYADLLTEAGDPRGEFVRVQLALEDPALDRETRRALRKREDDLLDDYGREWVGKTLARTLLGEQVYGLSRQREVTFRRGVFAELRHIVLTERIVDALARSKTVGWLRVFEVGLERTDIDLGRLERAAFAPWLRRLMVGDTHERDSARHRNLAAFLAKTPRLESLGVFGCGPELPAVFALPFPHLTELVVARTGRVPLGPLAANPSLGRLRRLAVGLPWVGCPRVVGLRDLAAVCRSPHLTGLAVLEFRQSDAGDAAADELIESGLLFRLERLSLADTELTDAGVERIVAALRSTPHRLRSCDVSANLGVSPQRWTTALPGVEIVIASEIISPVPEPGGPADDDPYEPTME